MKRNRERSLSVFGDFLHLTLCFIGTPEEIRTPDLLIRSLSYKQYPTLFQTLIWPTVAPNQFKLVDVRGDDPQISRSAFHVESPKVLHFPRG
jgi:hypothetical protein